MTRTRPRLFYGWWVVLISALALFLGPIPITVFSFGVFLKPLIQEFHEGRGAVSLAFTLHNAIVAFSMPVAGRVIDRFGARRVILASASMVGLILPSSYFCSGKIWHLYAFYLAVGIAGAGTAPVSYSDVISHWFDRYRGLALGFMLLGLGAGALIMPSAAHYITARLGWRFAFGIIGTTILVVNVPVLTRFLKERPEPMGLFPDGSAYTVTAPQSAYRSRPELARGVGRLDLLALVLRVYSRFNQRASVPNAHCRHPCGSGRACKSCSTRDIATWWRASDW